MSIFWKITRPNVCFLAILGVFVGALLSPATGTSSLILAMLAAFFICAAGNVINDICDYDIDKINKPERPLPSGKISQKDAVAYYFLLSATGIALSLSVSPSFTAIAILNFIIAALYAWKLKQIALVGNITDSFLASVTFIAGGLITGTYKDILTSPILILAIIAFLTTMGREIFKDIEDIIGDKAAGAKTLPILAGNKTSMTVARLFSGLGAFSAIIPYTYNMFGIFYLISVIPCTTMLLYSTTQKDPKKAQKTIKKGMFLGIFAFLVGAFTN